MLQGFKQFILKGNVVDLAVAVVIGTAFGKIVDSLVKDLITPSIGVLGGMPDFSSLVITVNGSSIMVGNFLNAFISFLIVAAVIYFFVVNPMNKIMAKVKSGQKVDPTEKSCTECLSLIPQAAKRCAFCTSTQPVKS